MSIELRFRGVLSPGEIKYNPQHPSYGLIASMASNNRSHKILASETTHQHGNPYARNELGQKDTLRIFHSLQSSYEFGNENQNRHWSRRHSSHIVFRFNRKSARSAEQNLVTHRKPGGCNSED
ncbi:hypothetical protein GQR58_015630 [Nymphon striatum]|nr:hypothetical protein GQR58_015630 [Nymphon striatum]